jgi:CRP-like cAMP-binding protein
MAYATACTNPALRRTLKGGDLFATLFGAATGEPFRYLPAQYPYAARLNQHHIRRLKASAKTTVFEQDSMLFQEGELCRGVFVVLEGRVRKSMTSPQGKALVLGFYGPGSVLGLDANIPGRRYGATAEAAQRTEALIVPRLELLAEIQNNATAGWQVAQLLSESCYFFRSKLGSIELSESASQKVARCLLQLAADSADVDGEHIYLRLSQETISQMVGIARETVSRQLSRLRKNGVLRWSRSGMVIQNRRALEDLANFPQAAA